ncbi:TetR/AcrR family transcriptional regulator [Parafrankia sp. FMc2]|uniref:TetR/AcrR family transcriptional regulator n=1 Tax=Parafrankia sp. FMc2 TaxID=3233196 RepID=UPI0034D79167
MPPRHPGTAPDDPPPLPDPSGVRARPGGRSARIRALVLAAVRADLVEHGYDSLTIDTIAVRSGVHRTTVYRRWRDVGGLLTDVLAEATANIWQPPDTGTLEGDLSAINREIYAALTADPPITTALIAASFRSPDAARALQAFWTDRYTRCRPVVDRAIVRAEIPADTDPHRLLIAATAPLYHQLILLRTPASQALPDQAAHDAAAAATAGAFTSQ